MAMAPKEKSSFVRDIVFIVVLLVSALGVQATLSSMQGTLDRFKPRLKAIERWLGDVEQRQRIIKERVDRQGAKIGVVFRDDEPAAGPTYVVTSPASSGDPGPRGQRGPRGRSGGNGNNGNGNNGGGGNPQPSPDPNCIYVAGQCVPRPVP